MNLLWLGPRRGKAENFFHSQGYCVRSFVEDLSPDDPVWSWMNYTVSFGYKHIIDKEKKALKDYKTELKKLNSILNSIKN